jgi:cell division protease FtsH
MKDMIATFLAGHVAESLTFGEMTTGGHEDIQRATKLARMMVTDYGMSDKLGPRTFGEKQELIFLGREISEQRDYSDKVAEMIDEEVYSIIQNAEETARKILTENNAKLKKIADRLIAQETLEGKELEDLFNEPVAASASETKAPPPVAPTDTTAKTKKKSMPKETPAISPKTLPKTSPSNA